MFDKIFGNFGMLAIAIIAFIGLIIGILYSTTQSETGKYDTQIKTGTTSLPTP